MPCGRRRTRNLLPCFNTTATNRRAVLCVRLGVFGKRAVMSCAKARQSRCTGHSAHLGETGVQIYASGLDSSANSFTVDDTSVNSVAYGGAVNTVPNAESIEEIRRMLNALRRAISRGK